MHFVLCYYLGVSLEGLVDVSGFGLGLVSWSWSWHCCSRLQDWCFVFGMFWSWGILYWGVNKCWKAVKMCKWGGM